MDDSNDMKNISKTTKTILFASLIAALVLPFSAMEFAEAAPNENANEKAIHDEKVKKLKDTKKSYEKKLAKETDVKKKEKLRQIISRGDLFVELEQILYEELTETSSKRIGEIHDELLNSYSPEDNSTVSEQPQFLTDLENSWIPPAFADSSGSYETSVQYRNNCGSSYGSSNGDYTAYDASPDYAQFSNEWQYPSTVKDSTADCDTYDFEDNYLGVFGWTIICTVNTSYSSGTLGCTNAGPGAFVTIWSNSNYESPVPNTQTHFTDIAGVTTKWL